jgi:hypothetical protein
MPFTPFLALPLATTNRHTQAHSPLPMAGRVVLRIIIVPQKGEHSETGSASRAAIH